MRTIIFIASVAALLYAGGSSLYAAEWYQTLRPGITRSEILKLAGTPSESRGTVDIYTKQGGRIECAYGEDGLRRAIYYNTPDGAAAWTLYDTYGDPKYNDLEQRRAYLKAGNFAVIPNFPGRSIYTQKYPAICWSNDSGACYEVDGGFIVVEPIIDLGGGCGFFADKAARVLWLKPDGTETVLYRAADHWKDLKPPLLPENQVKNRQIKLKQAGDHVLKMSITSIFGESDSQMGSGVDYRLFYLEDGLAILTSDGANGTIKSISILKPGITNLTLSEWLSGSQPDAPSKAASPPR
jgi:hypothetical protein